MSLPVPTDLIATAVLLTHNHYTVDVISAYFMGYAIYRLSLWLYEGIVEPLFAGPGPVRSGS